MDDAASADAFAHSANGLGRWHHLKQHLAAVRDLAHQFGGSLGLAEEARLAAILHDAGKYGAPFQSRLRGEARGIDHWSPGAWLALQSGRSVAAALAVQGHHIGLQCMDLEALRQLNPEKLSTNHPLGLTLSETDADTLLARLRSDGFSIGRVAEPVYGRPSTTPGAMLDVRFLFSCLVDADFLDTEAHFQETEAGTRYRDPGLPLTPERALAVLVRHVANLESRSEASTEVRTLRHDLWTACMEAGRQPSGLWTLTAPTGAGKTLGMLGFALQQAAVHSRRRVIFVIPYLSIIEQTVREIRGVLAPEFGPEYVLEDHSLTGTGREAARGDAENEGDWRVRLLAENWDAPIVVTTSVQFLESMFSNRPAACRKLHRIAQAVVLFDEVQTLPVELAVPTLATLAHLSGRFGTTVVFATATQPAFSSLSDSVREIEGRGWSPREVAPASLFGRVRRTQAEWPQPNQRIPWRALVEALGRKPQGLCVVNLKRHARDLALALRASGDASDGLLHLSTGMCPRHRKRVLDDARRRLAADKPCRLISTQCVEAGVDVDFPIVYRALGPLEAIAQAAGRCNREGKRPTGNVVVFVPEDDKYPGGERGIYARAAAVTRMLLERRGPQAMDLEDPRLFEAYYRELYDLARPWDLASDLLGDIRAQDFKEVARNYRLIAEDRINVLVPYEPAVFGSLVDEVMSRGITGRWLRQARDLAISIFRPRVTDRVWSELIALPLTRTARSDEWYYCPASSMYDDLVGFMPGEVPSFWMG